MHLDRRRPSRPIALMTLLIVPLAGCAITLTHDPLDLPREMRGPLAYQRVAEGPTGSVGWGRGTVFAIPMVPIFIKGDQHYGGEVLMTQLRDALLSAGYEPIVLEPGAPAGGPYLRCRFQGSYNNYTWAFPIVPTWGWLRVDAELLGPNGEVLWSDEFNGNGFTFNFFNGYTSAAKQSLNEVLDEAVAALTSEEFRVAMSRIEPVPVAGAEEEMPPVSVGPAQSGEPTGVEGAE